MKISVPLLLSVCYWIGAGSFIAACTTLQAGLMAFGFAMLAYTLGMIAYFDFNGDL